MLPSILAKQLKKGIGEYIETTFPMTNEPFKGSLQKMLETPDSIYHEPYISVRLPFRVADSMPTCFEGVEPEFLPFVHQQKAFERLTGNDGLSTLIATGTGSGKTECFQYPILEYCYQHRGEHGVKALIIYPMNALATDQAGRIARQIYNTPELRGNVTVGMYVGGLEEKASTAMSESTVITDRNTMLNNPPDILLTNYKMLDYLLVRPKDADLWSENKAETLKYIAVDELHTFDGAQGTDLACLLRRLKARLGTQPGYLCCIGTSATMGSPDTAKSIREYASEVFGEPFEEDSVITEDRLSPAEFFADYEVTDFAFPTQADIDELNKYVDEDKDEEYIKLAVSSWISDFSFDVSSDEGRVELGKSLMHHSFLQSMIYLMGGKYYQIKGITETLNGQYPALSELTDSDAAVSALLALVSYARTESNGYLRPYLNVQVQLWMRELRRWLSKVSADDITYAVGHDLNNMQAKHYLPVVNCRDCGATGWVTILNERQNAEIRDLSVFYNKYFSTDEKVLMMFPTAEDPETIHKPVAKLCTDCLHLDISDNHGNDCDECGGETVNVIVPEIRTFHKQYVCPFCGSKQGLSLLGMRSATEISASLSQIFASRFNDDKKTLAFSDNVQDAAHRAGFFNARTWKFGLRSAIQRYADNAGAGLSLDAFQEGFIEYWHSQMSREDFVSFFIAPNMTWMAAYEDMVAKRFLEETPAADRLIADIERRLKYEIMLEFGVTSHIGRTLEKSACSVIGFDTEEIKNIAAIVQERTVNELSAYTKLETKVFEQMVLGYLTLFRKSGAFYDNIFNAFTSSGGNEFLLANTRIRWLPGLQGGRNTPSFIAKKNSGFSGKLHFDSIDGRKYAAWVEACAKSFMEVGGTNEGVCRIIAEELIKAHYLLEMPSDAGYTVYGLNKSKVFVSNKVSRYACDDCGTAYFVATENEEIMAGAPCFRSCMGSWVKSEKTGLDYYGRLFSEGDVARINAKEHTGLLDRPERELLETDFKRKKGNRQNWDPNVLSCTPTLEMGIDIGDLSTVILCSMPPAQSQFLQRVGRAGRKDGNALTLAVAAARPHDLYFYADPLDMIEGEVQAPKVFLKASAVLERQFVAYCMDSWVRSGISEQAIPKKIGDCLSTFDTKDKAKFPFNFLKYVGDNLNSRLNSFMQMFAEDIDDNVRDELRTFARGQGLKEVPMQVKILEAFEALKRQRESLFADITEIQAMIADLQAKPKDSSYDEEIKELERELSAIREVVKGINNKDVFNFLSDEGLLPNYAFPEEGIVLRAVLYRKFDEDPEKEQKHKYEHLMFEYSRSASSAISEFAPNNSFYAGGKKLTVDQVDMATAQAESWRLCPNCSHAERVTPSTPTGACPRCGSTGWADNGQVRSMLKVQMVYSNMDYSKSFINDDSEDRANVFYTKQLLVDVDEDHDISKAYQMDNKDFAFGYEFVRKAVLREINFGESDTIGEKMLVAGENEVRKGFKVCKYCGKIADEKGNIKHAITCKTKKNPLLLSDAADDYLFLYREFQTEALRILIPSTTLDISAVRTESFTAAFMLGMKEYFGNVDHLRATVSEVPIPGEDIRKQYLVIYDSVPGGTGYLKQLMNEEGSLIDIFEKGLAVMENCSCHEDPNKDGCYHCLFAYRQSQRIGNISRDTATNLLKSILSGKENLKTIDRLSNVPVNSILDSELERRFMEAINSMGNDKRKVAVSSALVNTKNGYLLKINDVTWEVEPQVLLTPQDGVSVQCKPDFVLWPVTLNDRLPVAIFTDGFQYHHSIVDDDTLKREAIRRSGKFRVWSLSWNDVQSVFDSKKDYATATLAAEQMPSGTTMYKNMLGNGSAIDITPAKMGPMELLMQYLYMPNAEDAFKGQAKAYAMSLLEPAKKDNAAEYNIWNTAFDGVNSQTQFATGIFPQGGTFFGSWAPRTTDSDLSIYAGVNIASMQADKTTPASVCALLCDDETVRGSKYEQEWNGFWQFANVMQFLPQFMAATKTGIAKMSYMALTVPASTTSATPTVVGEESWDDVYSMLFDDESKAFAKKLEDTRLPKPDDYGLELEGDSGETVATIEMAWTDKKIAFITQDAIGDKATIESQGWTVITSEIELNSDIWGGND